MKQIAAFVAVTFILPWKVLGRGDPDPLKFCHPGDYWRVRADKHHPRFR